ncbi:MAG: hypothetical protein ACHQ4H_01965 [Ktedonobacterales bacterium]
MITWASLPCETLTIGADTLSGGLVLAASPHTSSGLTPIERLGSQFAADLRLLASRARADLASALDLPAAFVADPQLAVKLVAADVEQLWRDRLIDGAALVLTRDTVLGANLEVRCRLLYRLRATLDPLSAMPTAAEADTMERPPATLGLPERLPATRLHLLLSWTPAITRRGWAFPGPTYVFQWAPVTAARFSPAGSGDAWGEVEATEWTLCRLLRPQVVP